MTRRFGLILAIVLLLAAMGSPAGAQDGEDSGACPALVADALAAVGDACADLGRDEACYGHTQIAALDWDGAPLDDFTAAGDVVDVLALSSLATFPMDLDTGAWGVAVLSLQADLPESLPGQAVTFVLYGEAALRSEVAPSQAAAELPVCAARASGGVNLRAGPGTDYALAGSMAAGDEVTATGQTESGEWLRVDLDGVPAWVYAPLVALDCAPSDTLPTVTADDPVPMPPMGAFYLTTGFGDPLCAEAPRDGLLVQAPTDTVVHFVINGVEVEIGSTGLLAVEDGGLAVNTFAGEVIVTAAGQSQTVEPGFRVIAAADAAPTEPQPYTYADVQAAPVNLLPEAVTIPLSVPATAYDWIDSGVEVQAGQTFTLVGSGTASIFAACYEECNGHEFVTCDMCPELVDVGPAGGLGIVRQVLPGATPDKIAAFPMPDEVLGALLGRIGDGEPFLVAAGGTFTADRDGVLNFRMNDDIMDDNGGAFIVTVSVAE